MDTDDLSENAYKAVLIEAELLHHDLTLQFGVLAGRCNTEEDYLSASKSRVISWLAEPKKDFLMTRIFFDDPPGKIDFIRCLERILKNVEEVRQIPPEKRD
jgi:hypothetical protein